MIGPSFFKQKKTKRGQIWFNYIFMLNLLATSQLKASQNFLTSHYIFLFYTYLKKEAKKSKNTKFWIFEKINEF